jgi:NAD(P)-dependent dehydrogenase (short-subunit alcohol dehydrogenase family)
VPVNNAGITGTAPGISPADATDQLPSTVDLDTVRRVFETNVLGVIAVTNAMLPLLRRSPAPCIVNVSSHAASLTLTSDPDGPFAALLPSAAYNPSKSALSALTVQYANELRKDGVLVNAVAPGYVDTDSNNHTGFLTPAQAAVLVRLATLGADGADRRVLRGGRTTALVKGTGPYQGVRLETALNLDVRRSGRRRLRPVARRRSVSNAAGSSGRVPR